MQTMMGVPMWMSVISIGVIGTIYTSIGGIKAVGKCSYRKKVEASLPVFDMVGISFSLDGRVSVFHDFYWNGCYCWKGYLCFWWPRTHVSNC